MCLRYFVRNHTYNTNRYHCNISIRYIHRRINFLLLNEGNVLLHSSLLSNILYSRLSDVHTVCYVYIHANNPHLPSCLSQVLFDVWFLQHSATTFYGKAASIICTISTCNESRQYNSRRNNHICHSHLRAARYHWLLLYYLIRYSRELLINRIHNNSVDIWKR